jgi:hypothetical protein
MEVAPLNRDGGPQRGALPTAENAGVLVAPPEQDYCWFWASKGTTDSTMHFKLSKG